MIELIPVDDNRLFHSRLEAFYTVHGEKQTAAAIGLSSDWWLHPTLHHCIFTEEGEDIGIYFYEGFLDGKEKTATVHIGLSTEKQKPKHSNVVGRMFLDHLKRLGYVNVIGFIKSDNRVAKLYARRFGFLYSHLIQHGEHDVDVFAYRFGENK